MTNGHSTLRPVPDNINFSKSEEEVINLWKDLDAFRTQDKLRENRPKWSFYDGPPFATGLPHYGHILASTIKDTVCRDAVMNNFHVERRWGWDCHGLPIEYEIDKKFGISGPDAVAKMGIANYNQACRDIVMTYADQWQETITRLGRWIDFENDYKTMYPYFMESVWWVFKQIFDKGLVYKGFKVMPYSTKCCTPLANFEAGQNYQEVIDPAVVINFPLIDEPDTALVAWTTTPWTLPMNLATCVHPDLEYVKVLDKAKSKKYIMMEARLSELFKTEEDYEILQRYTGKQLEGRAYQPLFEYFGHFRERGAFRVVCDTYVTTDAGTGVVHQAPYCGEDDFRVCLREGIISKDGEVVCPLSATGTYLDKIEDFKGMYVKDADKHIMKYLVQAGRMVKQGQVKHNYPHCWRSDTPLLYMAVPSWFIRVDEHREALCKSNAATYWVPNNIKEKRFHNWLANARDWSISRNRYWGTPLPIWQSEDGEEIICIGSIRELAELSGVTVTDLHRENIDHITIPSAHPGKPPLKRVSEVFDCWFESGSMPYGQAHYPFNPATKKQFEDTFPANFIAEGVDQTRGWFYSLTVIGTLLYGQCPFKSLIVNGLVLAKDGTKMSKRKKNYTDPTLMINKYGADALRLYLINSPIVRGEDLRFKDEGVRDVCKDVFLPWFNAYRFLIQNVLLYQQQTGKTFELTPQLLANATNFMDRWILSELGSLVDFVKEEMRALRLYTVVPRLVDFFTILTNWYVRLNRSRLRGEENDAELALATLTNVLFVLSRRMAPCTPFLSEYIFQGIRPIISKEILGSGNSDSVHFMLVPDSKECGVIDAGVLRAMHALQNVVDLARVARERKVLPVRQPLRELVVVHEDSQILADIQALSAYIKSELNIKVLTTSSDKSKYNVKRCAVPDQVKLGRRLKKEAKPLYALIRQMTECQIDEYCAEGEIQLGGHTIGVGEIHTEYSAGEASGGKFEPNSNGEYLVLLDTKPSAELLREGTSRDIINRIQMAKKAAKLVPTDSVQILFEDLSKQQKLLAVCKDYHCAIQTHVRSTIIFGTGDVSDAEIFSQDAEIAELGSKVGAKMRVRIFGKVRLQSDIPLVMVDETTVLLENPKGVKLVSNGDDLACLISKLTNVSIANKLTSPPQPNAIYKIVNEALVNSDTSPTPSKIIKVYSDGKEYYLLSTNAGSALDSVQKLKSACERLLVSPDRRRGVLEVFSDKAKKHAVTNNDISGLASVYC